MAAVFRSRQCMVLTCLLVVITSLVYFFLMLSILGHNCLKTEENLIVFPNMRATATQRKRLKLFENDSYLARYVKDISENEESNILTLSNPLYDIYHNVNNDDNVLRERYAISQQRKKTKKGFDIANKELTKKLRKTDTNKSDNSKHTFQLTKPRMVYNCSSISRMKLINPIGRGASKQAFLGDIDGVRVAVKMVTRHIQSVQECLKRLKTHKDKHTQPGQEDDLKHIGKDGKDNDISLTRDKSENQRPSDTKSDNSEYDEEQRKSEEKKCYIPPTVRFLKEILMALEIEHPNIASLLGFCVRNEETDSTDMSLHGVVAVYELGTRFYIDRLQILPWQQRLHHALEMSDLLHYLQTSPLGSLIAPDMKESHLVTVKGKIKLIDLDDFTNLDPECDATGQSSHQCQLDTECIGNVCEGFNARHNLHTFNRLLFKRLLYPVTFPEHVIHRIGQLNARLDSLVLTAGDLSSELKELVDDLGATFTNNDLE